MFISFHNTRVIREVNRSSTVTRGNPLTKERSVAYLSCRPIWISVSDRLPSFIHLTLFNVSIHPHVDNRRLDIIVIKIKEFKSHIVQKLLLRNYN